MQNRVDIPLPPELRGEPEEQIRQLWAYIYRLVELLRISGEREN